MDMELRLPMTDNLEAFYLFRTCLIGKMAMREAP